jgi:hypothetical protein
MRCHQCGRKPREVTVRPVQLRDGHAVGACVIRYMICACGNEWTASERERRVA